MIFGRSLAERRKKAEKREKRRRVRSSSNIDEGDGSNVQRVRQADAVQTKGSLHQPEKKIGDGKSARTLSDETKEEADRIATDGNGRIKVDCMSSRSSGSISRGSCLKPSESRRLQSGEKNGVVVLRVRIDVQANRTAERRIEEAVSF